MKRLIYAPKAYIFIRSSNLSGRIYDVTHDVVRGTVTQNVGDVSKARFELRNRYQKWLRDPDSGNRAIFLPMDMVTVWLQRISGRPIQVFTGYLDSVPYYQGYPGNAIFEASCTLKKLAFTWFDPGLQFVQNWIMSQGGWTYNPQTGEATNPAYISQAELINGKLDATGRLSTVNDSGFAELLGRFMTDVAGWDSNDILISEIPKDLPKLAARLYMDIHSKTEADVQNLETFLGQAMGLQGWANPDPSTVTTADGTPAQNPAIVAVINTIKAQTPSNIPPLVTIFAAYILSGFHATRSVTQSDGGADWGYGLYALQPPISQTVLPDPFATAANNITTTIDGYTTEQLLDPATATKAFCARLQKYWDTYHKGAQNNDLMAILGWIQAALGRALPSADLTTMFTKAKQYAAMSLVVTPPTTSPSQSVDPSNMDFSSMALTGLLTDRDKQVLRDYYKNAQPWLAGILYAAKKVSRSISPSPSPTTLSNTNAIMLTSTSGTDLQKFFDSLKGNQYIDKVSMVVNGKISGLRNGQDSNVPDGVLGLNNVIVVTQSKRPPSQQLVTTDPASATTGSAVNAQGGINFTQLAAFSANAAFAANFAFPANALEARFLTGDRALMNDVSCLDAVKQFAKASLRTFRSLPDGRFLAFYPDYFGAYRKPYWSIYNIEITNFGIQLNDDALATHVYVVGDTFAGDGQIDQYDDIASRGVATITQAFMLNSFIQPYNPPANPNEPLPTPSIGRLHDAWTFLQHYGARPHKEEEPMIRNTFYEFLLAWQRFMQLWSQQFATTVTFTFQPEVMAGGLIAFPEHEIQMFCESVTHEWDYESGYQTSAVMTAPALLQGATDAEHMPGFALGGGVNTVGAVS